MIETVARGLFRPPRNLRRFETIAPGIWPGHPVLQGAGPDVEGFAGDVDQAVIPSARYTLCGQHVALEVRVALVVADAAIAARLLPLVAGVRRARAVHGGGASAGAVAGVAAKGVGDVAWQAIDEAEGSGH